jgi:hypothetical protein
MVITEDELKKLMAVQSCIEKITALSYDGKNLLTRIPKEIRDYLNLKKSNRFRWIVDSDKKILIEVIE